MKSAKLLLPALIAAALPAPVLAQARTYNFTPSERNGVCYVSFPGDYLPGTEKPMHLEFSYRVRDGNFGASLKVNGWPHAQEADPDANLPMTITFDTGQESTSRSGGFSSGFNDQAWGGWGAGAGSDATFAMLREASSVRVRIGGKDFGPFHLQLKGLAHVSLSDCRQRLTSGS